MHVASRERVSRLAENEQQEASVGKRVNLLLGSRPQIRVRSPTKTSKGAERLSVMLAENAGSWVATIRHDDSQVSEVRAASREDAAWQAYVKLTEQFVELFGTPHG